MVDTEMREFLKQIKIDLKNIKMENDITYYNKISNSINYIKEDIENKHKLIHEDDDNTNKVLEDVVDNLDAATCRLEDLHFYDGDGNRLS